MQGYNGRLEGVGQRLYNNKAIQGSSTSYKKCVLLATASLLALPLFAQESQAQPCPTNPDGSVSILTDGTTCSATLSGTLDSPVIIEANNVDLTLSGTASATTGADFLTTNSTGGGTPIDNVTVTIEAGADFSGDGSSGGTFNFEEVDNLTFVNNGSLSKDGALADVVNVDAQTGFTPSASANVTNNGTISSIGVGSDGIRLDNIVGTVTNTGTINTDSTSNTNGSHGISVFATRDIDVQNSGDITTNNGNGITVNLAFSGGTANITNSGSLTTAGTGAGSAGINLGSANGSSIVNNTGSIETSGDNAVGLYLSGVNASATNSAEIRSGASSMITTSGAGAHGVAVTSNSNVSDLDLAGDITTSGDGASGVVIDEDSAISNVSGLGNSITTTGANAHGLDVQNTSLGLDITNTTDISTSGSASIGLNLSGAGDTVVNASGAEISSSASDGEGIVFNSSVGASNSLTNEGTITAGQNAVRGGAGDEVITNNGLLTGTITLGAGTDSVTNTSTINGTVNLGDGNDSFTHLAGSSVTAVDGGAGTDSATFTIAGTDAAETIDASDFTNIETADHSAGGDLTLTNTVSFDTVTVGTNSTLRLQAADAASTTTTLDAGGVLEIDAASTLTNPDDNGTAVQAVGDGVTVTNQGTVSATGADGTAISLFGGANSITNGGNISATGIAISGAAGDDSINNDGTISGNVNLAGGNDIVTNTGSISGNIDLGDGTNSITNDGTLSSTGITVASGTGNDTVTNNSSITGGINLAAGNDVITNSGSISGSVDLGDGDDSFTHLAGSSEAAVDGGAGTDTATFTIAGTDAAETIDASAFTNFETADHSAGGDLTFTNTVSFDTVVVGTNSTLRFQSADAASVTTTLDAGSVLEVDTASTLANPNDNGTAVQAVGDGVTIDNQGALSASSTGGTAIALSGGTNTITNSGVISGTGASITGGSGADIIDNNGIITGDAQLGAGDDRVTLTATAMFNGSIDFGDGDDTLVVDVADGDSKTIDRVAFDPFNNLETFEKTGSGALFIDAATTATARDSFIRAGLFQVDGIYNSNVFIDAASALQGSGQIGGDVTISGQYSAGVGLGQVTIDGDLTLDGNSVFIVDLNLDNADLSFVGGAATFQNGILVVMPDGTVVSPDATPFRHEIVRTQDGVTQSFSDIDAGGLGRAVVFVEGNSLFIEIIPALGDGEIYTAVPSLGSTAALSVIDALNGQLIDRRGVENGRVDLWVTSLNDFSRYHGDVFTDTSDYHVDVHGVMAGLGYGLTDNWTIGAFTGYQNLDQDFSNLAATVDGDNIFFGLYTIGDFGRFNLNGALAYHASDFYSSRSPGNGRTANASFDADVFTAHGRLGYELISSDAFVFEPYAGLAYVSIDRQGFEERGADGANLEVFGDKTRFAYLDLGARIQGGLFGGSLIPHISAAWRYDLLDENNAITQRFASGGPTFSIAGADLERSRLNAAAGLLAYLSESFSIYATYDGEFGNALTSHGVRAGFSYKF